MANNYTDLSESELARMIEKAQKALKDRQEGKRKEVLAKIKELASSIGVTAEISEATKSTGRKGTKVPVKYQNPHNLAQKWTGRGVKPKWLQALIDQGHDIKEFELNG